MEEPLVIGKPTKDKKYWKDEVNKYLNEGDDDDSKS